MQFVDSVRTETKELIGRLDGAAACSRPEPVISGLRQRQLPNVREFLAGKGTSQS